MIKQPTYLYTYLRHIDEHDLCRLEMRAFFGTDTSSNVLRSHVAIDPDRSPFMKGRLEVLYEAKDLDHLKEQIRTFQTETTFKVLSLNDMQLQSTPKMGHTERRQIERMIGLLLQGEADLDQPSTILGVVLYKDRWYFGHYLESKAVWFQHQQKPHMYSTALSTRVARAVANIAVPHPEGVRAIDPCCGIGTVLVEAKSMGIDIVGRDINPLVVYGSRKNLAHFNLHTEVTIGPIAEVEDTYDVAIIDMPYNLFTHITPEGQLQILQEARRIADKVVVVTIDTLDHFIAEAGFSIIDRAIAKKGRFHRQVVVCH